jgi:hypothetical protein
MPEQDLLRTGPREILPSLLPDDLFHPRGDQCVPEGEFGEVVLLLRTGLEGE